MLELVFPVRFVLALCNEAQFSLKISLDTAVRGVGAKQLKQTLAEGRQSARTRGDKERRLGDW
jgi:hypothetical protein